MWLHRLGRLARPPVVVPLAVYGASRLLTLLVAHMATVINPSRRVVDVLTLWDGGWYLLIASRGYVTTVSGADGGQSPVAFFPGYPLAVRWLSDATRLPLATVAIALSMLGGAVASVLLWRLVADLADEAAATRAIALFAFFPGAFVFSLAYSEGLFLALAAGCLLALHRRWWVVAGLTAAAASATRPTGLILTACCAWAAVVAWRREPRSWRPLVAPLLAPAGLVAYASYLEAHSGRFTAFVDAQEAWDQRFDFGAYTVSRLADFVVDPLGDFNLLVSAAIIVFVAFGGWALWRWRPPAILVIYTVGIMVPALTSTVLTSTSRFTLAAFPLLAAVAVVVEGTVFTVGLAVSSACMAGLLLVVGLSSGLTP